MKNIFFYICCILIITSNAKCEYDNSNKLSVSIADSKMKKYFVRSYSVREEPHNILKVTEAWEDSVCFDLYDSGRKVGLTPLFYRLLFRTDESNKAYNIRTYLRTWMLIPLHEDFLSGMGIAGYPKVYFAERLGHPLPDSFAINMVKLPKGSVGIIALPKSAYEDSVICTLIFQAQK